VKNREALLFFLAALMFAASAVIDYSEERRLDTGDWLSLLAAALFFAAGLQRLRRRKAD
jgi:hypothetical protein